MGMSTGLAREGTAVEEHGKFFDKNFLLAQSTNYLNDRLEHLLLLPTILITKKTSPKTNLHMPLLFVHILLVIPGATQLGGTTTPVRI